MPLTDKPSVYLDFSGDNDKIQLTNPVSLGDTWTVEAWFSLPSADRENLEQNIIEQKLQATAPEQDAHFGTSIAISGNTAIVGANLEDTEGNYLGAAYILERDSNGTWIEKQKIQASDTKVGDFFGYSVAISENIAIIGANQGDTGGNCAGAAYIFERDSNGTWIEKQKLLASDAEAGDFFGYSVAISENVAIIGANLEDTGGSNAGAAYIFERDSNGTWIEKQKLLASDKKSYYEFGSSVAIHDNLALIGAYGEGASAGAAFIFERDNKGTWKKKQKLLASDPQAVYFGNSVAIHGDVALIGAYGEIGAGTNAGAAYLFERDSNGTWAEKQKLLANDSQANDNFGYSVAISNNFALVGAYGEDTGGNNAGAVYIFERDSSDTWVETNKLLAKDPQAEDKFGNSVAISDNFALVGANSKDGEEGQSNAGVAYIFAVSLLEPSTRVLLASIDGDAPVTIKDKFTLGTVVEGVFYDSGYNLEQLTPGWHHLAAVGEDITTKFYLNGQKVADVKQALIDTLPDDASKQEIEAKICKTNDDISTIGNVINGFKQFGQLAELRIWNLARSNQEIVDNRAIGLRGNEPGLTAYYPLNEAEGNVIKNLTDNSSNGTVVDATWQGDAPPLGSQRSKVMHFDGVDNYISVPLDEPETEITHELWFKTTKDNTGLFSITNNRGSSNDRHIYLKDGNIYTRVWKSETIGTKGLDLADGKWHHVAHVIGKSVAGQQIYVDGELIAEGDKDTSDFDSDTLVRIGFSSDADHDYFDGQLAEVRIWNTARTDEEIKGNMHQGLRGNESGLIAYYPLNRIQKEGNGDTQKVVDLTTNQNHATVHGAQLVNNLDLDHQVVRFDGVDDYIEVPYSATLNPDKFTVSCWVKVTGGVNSYRSPITSRNNSPNLQGYKFYAGDNNKWQMWIGNGEKWQAVTGSDVILNTWTHLAGTYDGSKLKLYIDGKFVSELKTAFVANTASPLRIAGGRSESTVKYLLPGQVAEVRIWNKASTAEEIEWYMHQRLRGDESELVAYYPLNEIQEEGDTQKVLDYTNNKNHGVVHGASLVNHLDHRGIEFSGQNDYIEVPAHTNPTKAITVSLWAKSNTENWNDYGFLASKRNAYILHPWINTKNIKFFIYASGWKSVEYTPSDIMQWHHYTGTFDGKILKLFIDGVEVASNSVFSRKTAINKDDGALYIGKDDTLERYFNGQISEVSIWNKALTAEAIQGYMHQGLKGNESGLVFYLPLNEIQTEGDTQKVLDLTSKKNHGIVQGALLADNKEPQGMIFDGIKDYINCGESINLANRSFTISFWARRHSSSPEKSICVVAQAAKNVPDSNHGLLIGFRENTDNFFLAFWGNPLDTYDSYKDTDWHYWSCTFDHITKRQTIYRDGVFIIERTADSNSLASGDFLLGCFFRNRYYFHGELAEVSIWNHALTEVQIQGNMNQILSGQEPGLVAYLPLDKISGEGKQS